VDRITDAQTSAASDPEKRHGPQAARVLLEGAGWIGGANVHVGDVVNVDARAVVLNAPPPSASIEELEARIAAARARLGLSPPA
jgi:serine acetyltransferase